MDLLCMAMNITMATNLLPNIPIHRTSGKLRLPASGDFQRYAFKETT